VEVSTSDTFVEGSDVPSIILSAFQSVQCKCPSSSASDDRCYGTDRQATTTKSTCNSCKQQLSSRDSHTDKESKQCSEQQHSSATHSATRKHWRPLLLVIPLRLGLSEINPVYFSAIKVSKHLAHMHTPFHSHFPFKPGQACCPLNFFSPFVHNLCFLQRLCSTSCEH